MKTRMDFCIVFCMCRKEYDSVQESDLQRASKILRTEFGSDWKQIVQTLGTRETVCIPLSLYMFLPGSPHNSHTGFSLDPFLISGNPYPAYSLLLFDILFPCFSFSSKRLFSVLLPTHLSDTAPDVFHLLSPHDPYKQQKVLQSTA